MSKLHKNSPNQEGFDELDEFSSEAFEDNLFSHIDGDNSDHQNSNFLVVGILILVVAGIAFLLFDSFASETYFYSVDEAVANGDALIGETVRVKGVVEPGSIIGQDGDLGRIFRITENGKTLKVEYNKAMPDTFAEDMEVVVHGKVNDSMVLVADEVLVKCPSRYEGSPPSEHPSHIPMKSS